MLGTLQRNIMCLFKVPKASPQNMCMPAEGTPFSVVSSSSFRIVDGKNR